MTTRPITVGYDGSDGARAALRRALDGGRVREGNADTDRGRC
jgi:hypothetical protein